MNALRVFALLLAAGSAPVQAQQPVDAPAGAGFERQEIRAQLLPRQFTTLAAEIGAKVNKLPVPEGGAFKAGQPLVTFDCSVQQAMLQKARAELNAAEATDRANQRLAELNSVGQLEVDLGRAGRQKAVAEVGVQQAVLAKCSIAAPFAGRVAGPVPLSAARTLRRAVA